MAKVSVVVPVYNVEKYIEKCVNSIVNQTFKDIEIILVDDGSVDNSLEICKKNAENDDRVIVKCNGKMGVSEARNTGIREASGEYIIFVDSDDWLETNMIEKLYEKAKNSLSEIIICSTYVNTENNEYVNNFFDKEMIFEGENKAILQRQAITRLKGEYETKTMGCGTPWAKIYKKSFITENNLWFDKKLPRGQDVAFNLYAFEYAKSIEYINIPLYHYRKNNSSLCNNYDEATLKKYESLLNAIKEFIDNTAKCKMKITEAYDVKIFGVLSIYIDQLLRKDNPKFKNAEIIEKINDYIKKYDENMKEVNEKYLTTISKIKLKLIRKKRIKILLLLMKVIKIKYDFDRSKNFK